MTERLPRLQQHTAATRLAVREALGASNPPAGSLVLVALSGGADSLALAAATAFEADKAGLRAGAIIVDHGLQAESAGVAERAAESARALGLDPVEVRRVRVGTAGGPESAARDARYAALREAAAVHGAHRILTGHTLDDQAETVLLGLARGSGTGSLQGMRPDTGEILRPLLAVRRSDTLAACAEAGLTPWQDPHNADPAYRRVRVRERVLPLLETELGPGIAEALARTAEQSREDEDSFAEMIEEFIEEIVEPAEAGIAVLVSALEANPPALRQRIIRLVAKAEFGVSLSRQHTLEIAKLVTGWTGQGEIHVPGIRVKRADGRLRFRAVGSAE